MTTVSIRPSTRRLGTLSALVLAGLLISPIGMSAQETKAKTPATERQTAPSEPAKAEDLLRLQYAAVGAAEFVVFQFLEGM